MAERRAFQLPLVQVSRKGVQTVVWGQVRTGTGHRSFRIQERRGGSWAWPDSTRLTDARGFFTVGVSAPAGSELRVWSPHDQAFGPTLVVT